MIFPKQLLTHRKKRGLTQQALAEKVGVHVTQIKRYEAGTSQPTLEIFRNIALTLNVSADEMIFEEADRGPDEDLKLLFEAVSKMDDWEKAVVKELIEGMLLKHDAKRWTIQKVPQPEQAPEA